MSKLEEEYFSRFTNNRLLAARKKISKLQKENHGDSYVIRIFRGKKIKISRRKIDKEIVPMKTREFLIYVIELAGFFL